MIMAHHDNPQDIQSLFKQQVIGKLVKIAAPVA